MTIVSSVPVPQPNQTPAPVVKTSQVSVSRPQPKAEVSSPAAPEKTGAKETAESTPAAASIPEGTEKKSTSADSLARLNKVERQRLDAERQLKAISAEKELTSKELAELKDWMSSSKTDPLKALERLGLDFETIAQAVLNDGKLPKEKLTESKVDELEKKLKDIESRRQDEEQQRQRAQTQRNVDAYLGTMQAKIQTEAERYELCGINGQTTIDDAWQLSEEFYKETGRIPDPASVLDQLEAMYESETTDRFTRSKKLAAKFAPPKEEKAPQKKAPPALGGNKTRSVPVADPSKRKENDADKRKRLIAWANDALKKK